MICCGVPRTLPSGPELSNTRLTTLPKDRGLRDLLRERDLEDLIVPLFWSGAKRRLDAVGVVIQRGKQGK